MSQEVIINIGVSGAGKTTWSEKFIQKNPNYIRINRDDIRKTLRVSLDGYYQQEKNLLNNIENLINNIEDTIYIKALNRGFSVIIDNTNLKISYIQRWVDFVNIYNQSKVKFGDNVTFRLKLFIENDSNILKKRIDVRDAPLGWDKLDYIDKQINSITSVISYVEDNYKNYILND